MSRDDEQGHPEPPPIGGEAARLVGSLERQRATLAWKCADLDADGLRFRLESSAVTLGGLLKHLVDMVEEYGRHTGHADLIREAVDGRVGEDPPGRPCPYELP